MRAKPVKLKRRSRQLRRESDEHLWFVTTRVAEARYWLHPILSCGLQPPNRAARRLCAHYERHLDKRLSHCVKQANARRGPHQPVLTLQEAKHIARGAVGSAFARAQARYGTQIFGLVVLSNHLHLLVRTPTMVTTDATSRAVGIDVRFAMLPQIKLPKDMEPKKQTR